MRTTGRGRVRPRTRHPRRLHDGPRAGATTGRTWSWAGRCCSASTRCWQQPGVSYRCGFYGPVERYYLSQGARIEHVPGGFRQFGADPGPLRAHGCMVVQAAPPDAARRPQPLPPLRGHPGRAPPGRSGPRAPAGGGGEPQPAPHRLPGALPQHAAPRARWTCWWRRTASPSPCPRTEPTEVDRAIAANALAFVSDGVTLQTGIGGVPSMVATRLAEADGGDYGVHSEMFTDGLMRLHRAGKVTNAAKGEFQGVSVTTFALGSAELYGWLDGNPEVAFLPVEVVNDPTVIGGNAKFDLDQRGAAVDLYGQIVADNVGGRQVSGVGGHEDFVAGAELHLDSRSLVCLPSTVDRRRRGWSRASWPPLPAGVGGLHPPPPHRGGGHRVRLGRPGGADGRASGPGPWPRSPTPSSATGCGRPPRSWAGAEPLAEGAEVGDAGLDPAHGAEPPLPVARPALLVGGHLGVGQHQEPLGSAMASSTASATASGAASMPSRPAVASATSAVARRWPPGHLAVQTPWGHGARTRIPASPWVMESHSAGPPRRAWSRSRGPPSWSRTPPPRPCAPGSPAAPEHGGEDGPRRMDVAHDVDGPDAVPGGRVRSMPVAARMPALAQKMSTRPKPSRSRPPGRPPGRHRPRRRDRRRPARPAPSSSATAAAPGPSMSATTVARAPAPAKPRHRARPMPLAPPVTTTTRPAASTSVPPCGPPGHGLGVAGEVGVVGDRPAYFLRAASRLAGRYSVGQTRHGDGSPSARCGPRSPCAPRQRRP